MKLYYEHAGITIYHGDCREVLPNIGSVDLVLTDPPFSEKTHAGVRSNVSGEAKSGGFNPLDFDSVTAEYVRSVLGQCRASRWVISFIDWRHALCLEQNPPDGLEFIRLGIWSKLNPMPQLTGDRPSTGWEAVAILHPPGAKRWNGGGNPALWLHGTSRYGYFGPSDHPTQKPLGLIRLMMRQFSDVGETILDPFMGSGTTLEAAKKMDRRAIGIEIEERYCEIAAKRLSQEVLDFGVSA